MWWPPDEQGPPLQAVRRSVTIRSEEPLEKMFDGDLCGWTPVEATVLPGGLQVVLPE